MPRRRGVSGAAAQVQMPAAFDIPGVGRIAMVADPQGVPFYLMRGASDERQHQRYSSGTAAGHVAWNELMTSHRAGGASPSIASSSATCRTGRWIWARDGRIQLHQATDGQIVGAVMNASPSRARPLWQFYFRVPDIDARRRAVDGGRRPGAVRADGRPRRRARSTGVDPQGAAFGLVSARGRTEERDNDRNKMITCLWFDHGKAREAAEFYAATFPDSRSAGARRGLGDYPGGEEGNELTVEFTLLGQSFVGLNGGPNFKPNEAVSFMVMTEDQDETDRYWNAIVGNGGAGKRVRLVQGQMGLFLADHAARPARGDGPIPTRPPPSARSTR